MKSYHREGLFEIKQTSPYHPGQLILKSHRFKDMHIGYLILFNKQLIFNSKGDHFGETLELKSHL